MMKNVDPGFPDLSGDLNDKFPDGFLTGRSKGRVIEFEEEKSEDEEGEAKEDFLLSH
jgi:hypothetical protein